jgi:hypothetical protein
MATSFEGSAVWLGSEMLIEDGPNLFKDLFSYFASSAVSLTLLEHDLRQLDGVAKAASVRVTSEFHLRFSV